MNRAGLAARGRLASLWTSQVARVLADNCLRLFVVLHLARAGGTQRDTAWHLVAVLFALPPIVLAPLNGALSNSLPKRRVLVGGAAWCLAVVIVFGLLDGPWTACWALVALGWAVYSPTRYALLPAAAEDTGIPLTRVNGWIEMGAMAAVVGGLLLGGRLYERSHYEADVPEPVFAAAILNLLGLLAALPVRFAGDVRRAEPLQQALAGFFRDARRILRSPESRGYLLGLAVLRGLVVAMTGAVVACTLGRTADEGPAGPVPELLRVGVWILVGLAAGSLLAGVQGHPQRALGLVPLAGTGLVVGLTWAAAVAGEDVPSWLCVGLGAMGGLVNVPLAAAYQAAVLADTRGNAMAVRNLIEYAFMAVLPAALYGLASRGLLSPLGQLWLVAGLAAVAVAVAWRLLLRQTMEQVTEVVLWPFYRIRAHGLGVGKVPRRGPLLVIANHSAYMDPLWIAKVLPRRLTPMMTSVYYDRPALRWLMESVVGAIRVQASAFRREVPEIDEAIAALDRGACLVIFPEGALRKREDQPLRQFGQGVWRILKARPRTPVLVLWIEGGWGSYLSYHGGPPGTNKRLDWWRRIDIGVGEARPIDPAILADQRATRAYLMKTCLESRHFLGLEPLTPNEPEADELKEIGG
jgi:1-acyl-sn-glycerol-3-phosphate acyltransferase